MTINIGTPSLQNVLSFGVTVYVAEGGTINLGSVNQSTTTMPASQLGTGGIADIAKFTTIGTLEVPPDIITEGQSKQVMFGQKKTAVQMSSAVRSEITVAEMHPEMYAFLKDYSENRKLIDFLFVDMLTARRYVSYLANVNIILDETRSYKVEEIHKAVMKIDFSVATTHKHFGTWKLT
jgi:hypothetical protein